MADAAVFQQAAFQARFEWGYEGVRTLAPVSDVVVIVDVLSFTTCVDVVLGRQGLVFPYRDKDSTAAEYARSRKAVLAGRRGELFSLSPSSLCAVPLAARIVLPSPNGATCSFLAKEFGCTVVAACLRNACAAARFVQRHGGTVSVIACGERWPDGSLCPAAEDLVGAGAVLAHLEGYRLSPEARTAVSAYQSCRDHLLEFLTETSSGQELTARGFADDLTVASAWNASRAVPVLNGEGAFSAHRCTMTGTDSTGNA